MNFGRISQAECVNVAAPADPRCADDAFRLANPEVCPTEPLLIIKPAVVLSCILGSVQFKAFYIQNNAEIDVTDQAVFQSSDPNTAVVGAASGNATGLSAGSATISATYLGKTAFADLSILGGDCCDEESVAMMVVVDRSRSMGQLFNGSYATKLIFAKAAAARFISEVNQTKDLIGLMQFTALTNEVLSPPTDDKIAVGAMVAGITQTLQSTTLYDALNTAVAQLAAVTADRKVIVLISDGEDQDATYLDETNPIALMSEFKGSGGIVICLGVRAHDAGYGLLSALATGGFFINGYDGVAAVALDYLSGLKGYICAGNCSPTGDEFVASGSLNYCRFANWNVVDGHVDLIGNGFMDLLPGNDLYVDLAGSRSAYKGTMISKEAIAIEAGKQYRLSLSLAGNQRVNATPNTVQLKVFSRNTDGLTSPSIAPTPAVATGSGAADLENYDYAVSYANANGETPLSPVASENNGTYETFAIELTATAMPTASIIRWWKRETGTTTWYLIGEGDPATAPAFTDTLSLAAIAAMVAAGTIDACEQPIASNTTGTPIILLNQAVSLNSFQQDFQSFSYTFTAPGDADVFISIQQTATPAGYDATGLLLDAIKFSNATDLVDMFEDDFSTENMQYVPPACGVTSNYVVIGHEPTNETALIPAMSDDTTPSGTVSAINDGAGSQTSAFQAFDGDDTTNWQATSVDVGTFGTPLWLQYQFAAPILVTGYSIYGQCSTDDCIQSRFNPKSWRVQGSNNGSVWTDLDVQSGHNTWPGAFPTPKSFTFNNSTLYSYYRLSVESVVDPTADSVSVSMFQLFNGGVGDPIYGYESFYNCYGEGCLTEPPAAQAEDPHPLNDIESGYVPPGVFTSSKRVCVSCPAGFTNASPDNLVPDMTSATLPSGVVISSAGAAVGYEAWKVFDRDDSTFMDLVGTISGYVGYNFPAAKVVTSYQMTARADYTLSAPRNWTFEGSNNGSTWTVLNTQTNTGWYAGQAKLFSFTNTTAYTYYRLNITSNMSGEATSNLSLAELEMFSTVSSQVCADGTGSSETSQGAADAEATTNATAAANALLNCVPFWTKTEIVTVPCPNGTFGASQTANATVTSYVSEQDATDRAIAQATAIATGLLVCDMSNNDEQIVLTSGASATALPYPSVEHFAASATITKVTVTINNLTHTFPDDMNILLVSPAGTMVSIMRHCGGNNLVTNLDFVFDDAAGSFLPDATVLSAGTFKPSTFGANTIPPSPAPQSVPLTTLAAFIGENKQGSWALWCFDSLGGGGGSIDSWSLTITP